MNQDMNTIEIAKLYETQGYHEDAFLIYQSLDQQHSSSQTRAGVTRLEKKIAAACEADIGPISKKRIAELFEKWLKLIVLKHRLDRFKNIKSRLI